MRILWLLTYAFCCVSPALAEETADMSDTSRTAVFAGGCFWCMEPPYDTLPGVLSTVSGYTGGQMDNPTYEQVSSGRSGHLEVLQVTFDPAKVSYEELLNVFWQNIDPLNPDGQFCDRGEQYRSAVFVSNEEEQAAAESSRKKVEALLGRTVATEILDASIFYPAEDYHQDYYKENPTRYKFYRWNCGRDKRLEELWGKHQPLNLFE